jgi:hypothetical protein
MVGILIAGNLDDKSKMTINCVLKTLFKINENVKVIAVQLSRLQGFLGDEYKDKIIPYDCCHLCKDYKEAVELADSIIEEYNIDTLLIYKSALATAYDNKNMSLAKAVLRNYDEGIYNKRWSFITTRMLLFKFMFIWRASIKCKNIYNFVLDPQEPDYRLVIDFKNYKILYGMQRKDMIYMPCFEYGVLEQCKDYDRTKTINFMFYCGAVTEDRKFIADRKEELESIEGFDIRIFTRGRTKDNKPVNQEDYYKNLARTRYTCCIQAYDKTAFSMYRFTEALINDCLSFVFYDCCLDDVKNTFPDMYEIMNKYLIVNDFDEVIDNVNNWKESKRVKIINMLKETKSYKRFTDLNFIKKRWEKLDGWL